MTLRASRCSPVSCILNLLTVKPAVEKHLLEEADVAGMQKYFEASCFKKYFEASIRFGVNEHNQKKGG